MYTNNAAGVIFQKATREKNGDYDYHPSWNSGILSGSDAISKLFFITFGFWDTIFLISRAKVHRLASKIS